MVVHRFLVPLVVGSNPTTSATFHFHVEPPYINYVQFIAGVVSDRYSRIYYILIEY